MKAKVNAGYDENGRAKIDTEFSVGDNKYELIALGIFACAAVAIVGTIYDSKSSKGSVELFGFGKMLFGQ